MPRFNIVAVTGLNESVTVAQCWLAGEAEPDYVWALEALHWLQQTHHILQPDVILSDRALACLNALEAVFPGVDTMLCQWHIRNNVLARTRKVFKQIRNPEGTMPRYRDCPEAEAFMTKYQEIADSNTVAKVTTNCGALRVMSEELTQYLERHWWPYKTKIVRCWTNNIHELLAILDSRGAQRLLPTNFDIHWWVVPSHASSVLTRVLEPARKRTRAELTDSHHRSNSGIHRTRRDPLWSERIDRNHPAGDLPSTPRPTTSLHHGDHLHGEDVVSTMQYEEAFTPARRWAYAGRRW